MMPPTSEQRFAITLFRDEKDNAGESCVLEWPQLAALWRDVRPPYAWSPATFNGTRAKANVTGVSLLVLDVDGKNATGANVAVATALWQRLGIATVVHSSKSHTMAAHCYRVVLRLSRALTVAEHASVWTWARDWMASEGQVCDVNARDASRLWFFGAEPRDGSPFVFYDLPGAPLDVDGLLRIVRPSAAGPALPAAVETARVPVDPNSAEGQYRVTEFITRCREKLAPSIQGQYGSNKLLAAAGCGAYYYDLPEETVTAILWEHFNPRCEPPWELHDIQRKVSEAIRTADPTRPKCPPRGWGESLGRRASASTTPGEAKGTTAECTDVANVEQLVAWYGGDLRYVTKWDKFIAWDGKRWAQDDAAPMRFATATVRRMLTLAQDEQRRANEACAAAVAATGKADEATAAAKKRADRQVKHAIDSQYAPRLQAMVRLAKSRPEFAIKHTALDADGMLLNVANGTVDLRTGELRAHDRGDLITKLAPVVYDASACAPVWDRFLSTSMGGNASLIGFLQRAIGYALTGETREHVLGFCFGSGANGKTTFLATIHGMLGDYAKPAARSLLMKKRGDEHPTAQADLYGARFVTCSEIAQDQAFDEALVKDLTGGDPISARRMREDFWSFNPTHKLFIAGNHRPRVEGDDDGIWRRIRLIPWVVTIPATQRDPQLRDKLAAELPGILAWAVRGCLDWQHGGLGEPSEVTKATAEYREDSDPIGEFFTLRCVFDANAKTARRTIRLAYEAFCTENGAKPLDAKAFASRLRARGIENTAPVAIDGRRHDAWRGIRLLTDAERDSTEGRGTSSDQSGLVSIGRVSVSDRTAIDPSTSLWSLRRASGGDAE